MYIFFPPVREVLDDAAVRYTCYLLILVREYHNKKCAATLNESDGRELVYQRVLLFRPA